jgi:hypothetical protein|tara:strand:- start:5986 stop:6672 length:687 start_codon:yes stop_codon:yes gene_type:complete
MNSTCLGRAAVGTTGVAGRPLHDTPALASIAGTTSANTSANSTVSWTYTQAQGDAQSWYRVRGQNTGGSATYYDTGWLTGTASSVVVDMDEEHVPATTTIRWVVDVRGDEWVDAATPRFETQSTGDTVYAWGAPACVISTVEGIAVTSASVALGAATDVTLVWTFTDSGKTQSAFRARIREPATDIELWTSGWVASAATTYDLPFTFTDGLSYEITLQLKNNYGMRSS